MANTFHFEVSNLIFIIWVFVMFFYIFMLFEVCAWTHFFIPCAVVVVSMVVRNNNNNNNNHFIHASPRFPS